MPMNNESIRPDYVENYLTLINWMMKNHRDTSHLLVHDDTVNRNIDELPHAVAADMLAKNVNPVELAGYVETGESDSKRRENGIHFTPAEIVHRMIDPMLIKYQARLSDAKLVRDKTKRESALRAFIDDIARIRIMDPACGAGNILVETYECLRALEIDALVSLRALNADYDYTAVRVLVSSFYGIEVNENIARAADASLYVACILMAHVQSDALQVTCSETMNPSHAVIVIADALDADWNEILPASDDVMVYMNPPFIGSQRMKRTMPDMRAKVVNAAVKCGASESGARWVDAAAGWLYKSALYLRDCKHASFAAITAPNVSAGLQEKSVFPVIESLGWTCNLAWSSFHWKSASSDAATNVIITGFTMDASADKFAFDSDAVSLNITVPGIPSGSHVSLIDVSGAMQPVDAGEYDGDILKAYRRSPGVCTDSVVPEALKKTPGRPPKFDADHPFRTFLGSRNLRDAVMGTNPMFGEGPEYQNNCQRCVVAYEMRRRGYAVTAMPRPMDPRTGLPAIDTDTNRWVNAFKGDWRSCGPDTGLDGASKLLWEWGKGSRAFIEVEWLDGTRHVFVAENLKDGIHFIDPQTGSMNASRYFGIVNHGMTRIMRVDDADPTELVLKYCKEG